eukprot:CAMPEP_0197035194 /NCGR_PEP_ID=MMETSP1384-20130603/13052_1 /TAXON_ID=29189 /ORGANISM="Ammonia sp." /LENGTH=504 /DNA_ID=CAMNT_0042465223 /DNA_START=78 /DNA_END=1589 /DNA_ORIENTATION=+
MSYSEVVALNNAGSREYLMYPVIITDSPMSDWSVLQHFNRIFPPDYEMEGNYQEADCSCFGNSSESEQICHEYVSTFLYARDDDGSYEKWKPFEYKHERYKQYGSCVQRRQRTYYVRDLSETFNHIVHELDVVDDDHASHNNTYCATDNVDMHHMYNKSYTYFNILRLGGSHKPDISPLQLTLLDHIQLHPFYDIFNIERGFYDIDDVHIWFGNENYRAVRHFDRNENLFFMLKGSRTFRISPPTFNIFPLHPFNHKSARQQYPNYPVVDEEAEGWMLRNESEYDIWESALYSNELLYLPSSWFHEIVNDNYSCALSVWYTGTQLNYIREDLFNFRLPINPRKYDSMSVPETDEFFYFIQRVVDSFCSLRDGMRADPLMRCHGMGNVGYLLSHFRYLYPVLDELTAETIDWFDHEQQMFACARSRVDYHDFDEFKQHLSRCGELTEEYQREWDEAIEIFMDMLDAMCEIDCKITEGTLIEYIETLIVDIFGDSNLMPLVTRLMW